jgi:hypothetical protein
LRAVRSGDVEPAIVDAFVQHAAAHLDTVRGQRGTMRPARRLAERCTETRHLAL